MLRLSDSYPRHCYEFDIDKIYNLPSHISNCDNENVNVTCNFFLIKPKSLKNFPNFVLSTNSTCFGHFLCPSSGNFYCTFDIGIFLAGLMTASKQDQDKKMKFGKFVRLIDFIKNEFVTMHDHLKLMLHVMFDTKHTVVTVRTTCCYIRQLCTILIQCICLFFPWASQQTDFFFRKQH